MPPLQKTVVRPKGRSRSTGEDPRLTQHGRSSTGLAASTAAAAALQDFARGRSPPSKRSSATSSGSKGSFGSVRSGSLVTAGAITPDPTPHRHSSNTSPPSPLTPSKSLQNVEDNPGNASPNTNPSASMAMTSVPPSASLYSDAIHRAPPAPPPPRRGRTKLSGNTTAQQPSSNSGSRSQTPRNLSDLGRDYSRYPLTSRRSSFSASATTAPPTMGGESITAVGAGAPTLVNKEVPTAAITNIGLAVDSEKRTSWLLDDRIGAPGTADAGYNFPLYLDEKELDDDLHMPYPDDDARLKPKLRDFCVRSQLCSLFGMVFMFVGLLAVFILLPVLSYTGHAVYSYPYHSPPPNNSTSEELPAEPWTQVNTLKYPLLQNIRTGLIDPTTPKSAKTRRSFSGETLDLVFSDEFNTANRSFYPGDDPFWTAQDLWYGATQDLEYYDPDAVNTADGTLTLRMDQFLNHNLNYRSGMVNSWNQLCMKGGALEISASLPGPGGASGLWPGAWTMGNLGRPGFRASTDGIWPYTYNSCDSGITPNQSMTDGTSYLLGQKLPSCTCPNEDHPTPGTGRGAPEIDVFEASADPNLKLGVITQSYQVAPYDIWYQINYDHVAVPNYNFTQINSYCGGPYQQAISGQTELNNEWYNGTHYQKYGFEYTSGTLSDGQITWFVGNDISYMMTGNAVGPNGNVNSRVISEEPMAIVLNLGISPAWTGINFGELVFPTTMYVDYVRWYQPSGQTSVTCDPEGYETTQYIKDHPLAYNNINLTSWDETDYGWPKHKLNSKC